MNDDHQKDKDWTINEKPLSGKALLQHYAQISIREEKERDYHQDCSCCQEKKR